MLGIGVGIDCARPAARYRGCQAANELVAWHAEQGDRHRREKSARLIATTFGCFGTRGG
jgi:hypothetical protein